MERLIKNTATRGERLYTSIRRAKEGGVTAEGMTEKGREKFYTIQSAGVLRETDIRTNRLDMLMEANDMAARAGEAQAVALETEEKTTSDGAKAGSDE